MDVNITGTIGSAGTNGTSPGQAGGAGGVGGAAMAAMSTTPVSNVPADRAAFGETGAGLVAPPVHGALA
jgi:hypothetical protein